MPLDIFLEEWLEKFFESSLEEHLENFHEEILRIIPRDYWMIPSRKKYGEISVVILEKISVVILTKIP